jgi:hypothetical protein
MLAASRVNSIGERASARKAFPLSARITAWCLVSDPPLLAPAPIIPAWSITKLGREVKRLSTANAKKSRPTHLQHNSCAKSGD